MPPEPDTTDTDIVQPSTETPARGRPPRVIDLNQIENAASIGCTLEDMGLLFGLSARQIQRRQREAAFSLAIERGRAKGRFSLRRAQFKSALDGNVTAQIWLGKQMLGQRSFETPEAEKADTPPPLVINTYVVSDADQIDAPAEPSVQQPSEVPDTSGGKKIRKNVPIDK